MSTLAQIRTALLARMQAVPGIGKFNDYERYAVDRDAFRQLYFDPEQRRINGGFFYREATAERDLNSGEVRRLHRWRVILFRSLDDGDATGKSFDTVIEHLARALRADRTLGGVVIDLRDLTESPSGLQVERIEPVMFAGVLCHRATCSLITETTEPIF